MKTFKQILSESRNQKQDLNENILKQLLKFFRRRPNTPITPPTRPKPNFTEWDRAGKPPGQNMGRTIRPWAPYSHSAEAAARWHAQGMSYELIEYIISRGLRRNGQWRVSPGKLKDGRWYLKEYGDDGTVKRYYFWDDVSDKAVPPPPGWVPSKELEGLIDWVPGILPFSIPITNPSSGENYQDLGDYPSRENLPNYYA